MDPELSQFIQKGMNTMASGFEDDHVVMQFIPIVLILLFSLYSKSFIEISHSVLGKLFAVIVIIFYTKLNILYGVFACVITILFYQLTEGLTTNIEGMKNPKKKNKSAATPAVASSVAASASAAPVVAASAGAPVAPAVAASVAAASTNKIPQAATGISTSTSKEDVEEEDVEDGTNLPDDNGDNGDDADADVDADVDVEGFEYYKSLYPIINIEDFNAAKDEFIKEKCRNGIVMYKDMPVKPEMVDHVFSEIHFTTKTKCNPCDRTCAYSIVENKLATEEELARPKNSNDIFEWIKKLL